MRITIKREQKKTRFSLPDRSYLCDAGATMKKLPVMAAVATMLLTACCVKDPIYETPHPNYGRITLTTDWSNIDAELSVPENYLVRVGEYSTTVTGYTNTIDNLFIPDTYQVYVYNTADNITVRGTVVTANYMTGTLGWFFSHAMKATIERDKHHEFTAVMRQQVIEMSFTITPQGGITDRIESITGVLGGVAASMDMKTEERSAKTSVAMDFVKQSDGTWKATIRLIGIVGDEQPLTTTIKFIEGFPGDVSNAADIHDKIKDNFGSDGGPVSPGGGSPPDIDLGTTVVEETSEAGFTATITGWKKQTETGTAN